MTHELFWLTLTGVLAATMWMPFIILTTTQKENAEHISFLRMPKVWNMTDMTQRAYRAHQNIIEQFVPFAALVLIANAADVSNGLTVWTCVAFFWIRLAHAVRYITAFARMPIRPIIFTLGWVCCLLMAGAILFS